MSILAQEPEEVKQECDVEWCHEPVERDGLCWDHFMEEVLQEWENETAERQAQLNGTGCYLFGDPEPALDGGWWGWPVEEACG